MRSGLLDKKRMMERTRTLLEELEVDIKPDERIERLSTAQKQMVEISKAVAMDAKLLIMDEADHRTHPVRDRHSLPPHAPSQEPGRYHHLHLPQA